MRNYVILSAVLSYKCIYVCFWGNQSVFPIQHLEHTQLTALVFKVTRHNLMALYQDPVSVRFKHKQARAQGLTVRGASQFVGPHKISEFFFSTKCKFCTASQSITKCKSYTALHFTVLPSVNRTLHLRVLPTVNRTLYLRVSHSVNTTLYLRVLPSVNPTLHVRVSPSVNPKLYLANHDKVLLTDIITCSTVLIYSVV